MLDEVILYTTGALISLAAAYVPGVSTWYAAQPAANRGLIMLVAALLASALLLAGACLQLTTITQCDSTGARAMVLAFVRIMAGNQLTYLTVTKQASK